MALNDSFYQKLNEQPTTPAPVVSPMAASPAASQPPAPTQPIAPTQVPDVSMWESVKSLSNNLQAAWRARKEIGVAARKSLGISDSQQQWDNMPGYQKSLEVSRAALETTFNLAVGLPNELLRGALNLGLDVAEPIDVLQTKMSQFQGLEGRRILRERYNLPWEGDKGPGVTGWIAPYKTYRQQGASPFMAAVLVGGKVSGDALLTNMLRSMGASLARPTVSALTAEELSADVRPLVPQKVASIGTKVQEVNRSVLTAPGGQATGTRTVQGEVFSSKLGQNQSSNLLLLNPEVAKQFGGTPGRTYLRIVPAGEGMAKTSVIEIGPSPLRRLANLRKTVFGGKPGVTIQTEMGPATELRSAMVEYDPSVIKAAGDTLPDFLQPSGAAVATTPAQFSPQLQPLTTSRVPNLGNFTKPQTTPLNQPHAVLTWSDPGNVPLTPAENAARNVDLKNQLEAAGYHPIPSKGSYTGDNGITTVGDGFLVPGMTTQESLNWFGSPPQETILTHDGLVYSDGSIHPADNSKRSFSPTPTEPYTSIDTPSGPASWAVPVDFTKKIIPPTPISQTPTAPTTAPVIYGTRAIDESVMGFTTPSLIARPLKGFADKAVTPKQVAQLQFLQKEVGVSDQVTGMTIKALTGKNNPYDLTQQEIYNVSEALRSYPKAGALPTDPNAPQAPGTEDMMPISGYSHPARYWMQNVEEKLGYPVLSKIYYPVEYGISLARGLKFRWMDRFRQTYGKYAEPKYLEERRLITEFSKGNDAVITDNSTLDPVTKKELIQIGDWVKKFYDWVFKQSGLSYSRFNQIYSPELKVRGGLSNLYKNIDEVPPELKPFYQFERQGQLNILEDDSLALADAYISAFANNKYVYPQINEATGMMEQLPNNVKAAVNDYVQEKLGYRDEFGKAMDRWGVNLAKATNNFIKPDIFRQSINVLMTMSYAATLGVPRMMGVIQNVLQTMVMGYAELGEYFPGALIEGFDYKNIKAAKEAGFLVEKGVTYGEEMSTKVGAGKIAKAISPYLRVNEWSMKPNGWADSTGRTTIISGVTKRFNENFALFGQGKITWDQFEKNIKLPSYSQTFQDMIRGKLLTNTADSIKEARDLVIMETIDRTMFPYRRGTESRAFYGEIGKIGFQYASYPFELGHTVAKWVARKQWDTIFRFLAMSVLLKRTFQDSFGVSIWRQLGLGAFGGANLPIGPLAQAGARAVSTIVNLANGLTNDAAADWKDVAGALKNYGGIATGLGKQRIQSALDAIGQYERGFQSPDPERPFIISSGVGKAREAVSFADLLKYAFGLKPEESDEFSSRIKVINKAQALNQQRINQAMEALTRGKIDEFDRLVTKYDLQINDISTRLKSYYIPLDQRLFDRMPNNLKVKYFNLFFPYEPTQPPTP